MQPRLISIENAAKDLSLSPWTIRKMLADKRLDYVKLGRRVLIEQATIERLIEAGRRPATHGVSC